MKREAVTNKRWWVVVSPLLVVVALLSILTVASVEVLSSVRAYVGGESLWSKGQKDAAYHLERYVVTREPAEYAAFQRALAAPQGDARGRLALERDPPDRAVAREGFLAGGNHPDDVEGMLDLYLRYRNVGFMARAIDIWAEGDREIAQLAALGEHVHARIAAGDTGSPELRALAAQLPALNQRLTDLEFRFSSTLGEASRTVQQLVLGITLAFAVLLTGGAMLLTRTLMRAQLRAEEELRLANERWTLAADAAGIGLFDWDLDTKLSRLDGRAAALYGLPPEPVEVEGGQLTLSHIHPDDAPHFRTSLAQAIAQTGSSTIRYRVRQPDGRERHLEIVARVRPGDGATRQGPHLIGTLRDVTADVEAAQLRLEKEAAERGSRAKSELLSRVSHELRTPLNAVLGFSELLASDPQAPLTAVQGERVQHVIHAGRHLLALIDDILDLTDADDNVALPLEPVVLSGVVQAAFGRVRSLAEHHQVELRADLPGEPVQVMAEARRLAQVLVHLLSNAIKFNRPGGVAEVSCELVDDEVRIRVRDNGHGLSAQQLQQLFQPFIRLGAEAARQPGAGLGLVVVQRLVRRQQGRIELTSTPGEGTCAEVCLQAAGTPAE